MSKVKKALLSLRDTCANALVNLNTLRMLHSNEECEAFVTRLETTEHLIREFIRLLFKLNNNNT